MSNALGPRRLPFLLTETFLAVILAVIIVLPGDRQTYQVTVRDSGPATPRTCQGYSLPDKLPCGFHLEPIHDRCPRFSLATNTTCTPSLRRHWAPMPAIVVVMTTLAIAHRGLARRPSGNRRTRHAAVILVIGVLLAVTAGAATSAFVNGYVNSHDE